MAIFFYHPYRPNARSCTRESTGKTMKFNTDFGEVCFWGIFGALLGGIFLALALIFMPSRPRTFLTHHPEGFTAQSYFHKTIDSQFQISASPTRHTGLREGCYHQIITHCPRTNIPVEGITFDSPG